MFRIMGRKRLYVFHFSDGINYYPNWDIFKKTIIKQDVGKQE